MLTEFLHQLILGTVLIDANLIVELTRKVFRANWLVDQDEPDDGIADLLPRQFTVQIVVSSRAKKERDDGPARVNPRATSTNGSGDGAEAILCEIISGRKSDVMH